MNLKIQIHRKLGLKRVVILIVKFHKVVDEVD